jgi:hypothetical protein
MLPEYMQTTYRRIGGSDTSHAPYLYLRWQSEAGLDTTSRRVRLLNQGWTLGKTPRLILGLRNRRLLSFVETPSPLHHPICTPSELFVYTTASREGLLKGAEEGGFSSGDANRIMITTPEFFIGRLTRSKRKGVSHV